MLVSYVIGRKRMLSLISLCARFVRRPVCEKAVLYRHLCSASSTISHSTVDHSEVGKFTKHASTMWWDDSQLLRSMNSIRVPLVRDGILSTTNHKIKGPHPLKGYKIIDVGCGGGILSEPLARLGATVTGLDPGQENISVAISHASNDEEIKDRVTYVCDTVENIAVTNSGMYDAVVCSEVIEHVADVNAFINYCVDITKKGGSLFFTTLNRTYMSYVLAIIGAEYMFRILPPGTHNWNKFITPEELSNILLSLNCRIVSSEGIMYNPITRKFSWSGNCNTMYTLHALK